MSLVFVALVLLAQATPPETASSTVSEEIYVRARRIRRQPALITVRPEEARRVPGTQGDALKVVQNLPGVGRPQLGSGQLVVWGAAPKDTRIFVDGLEIPALYHLGGVRSVLSTDLVQSIDLLPGGYGADYGRGLGGIVRTTTKKLEHEEWGGFLAADFLDASGLIKIPITPKFRAAVAGRFGWLDRVVDALDDDFSEIFVVPKYSDYQAKATLDLRENEALSFLLLGAHDRLERAVLARDPKERKSESESLDFQRYSLAYERSFDDGTSVLVTPGITYERTRKNALYAGIPAQLEVEAWRWAVRAEYRAPLENWIKLSLGADAEGASHLVFRTGSLNVPAREGDLYVFGRPPGDDVAADDYRVELAGVAPFAVAELEFGPLKLSPGLRLDVFAVDGERALPANTTQLELGYFRTHFVFEPRIAFELQIFEPLSLRGAAGIYHQAPESEELSAVFGSPALGLARAHHATLGALVSLAAGVSAELTTYYEALDELVSRATNTTPQLARALVQRGEGTNIGAQVLLRKRFAAGLSGWLSYTLSRSERRDAPDLPVRLFDYDQTHVLSAVAGYEFESWNFGARVRWSSGFPRTPVESAFVDLRRDRFQPIFGEHNSTRIPAFFQADLRIERSFDFHPAKASIYLDLQNITFQKNVEELTYSADYQERGSITGLPFLGVLGARVEL